MMKMKKWIACVICVDPGGMRFYEPDNRSVFKKL